jgi:maltose O-acetyltransferase
MIERSEKQKMLAGELYNAMALTGERQRTQRLLARYNVSEPGDAAGRLALLRELLGAVGDGPDIQSRFHCDYGYNIRLGHRCFNNYNCVFLDCAPIEIGDDLQMAPAVQLYAATHPLDRATRVAGLEYARPIRIGSGVWIGGGAIVLPPLSLAVGNPAQVVRTLE